MLTREQQFFLNMLGDHLAKRTTEVPDGLDWRQICLYAKGHEVEGILYHQTRDYLLAHEDLAPYEKRLNRAYKMCQYAYVRRQIMLEQLKKEFAEEDIRFFVVKGDEVAKYYPYPALRTMGDIDIVMHTDDREKAHETMLKLGYQNASLGEYEWAYYKDSVEIELHNALAYDKANFTDIIQKYFAEFWEWTISEEDGLKLDPRYHFLYIVNHLRKHHVSSGAGFRQFIDVFAVVHAFEDEFDWDWMLTELEKMEIRTFFEKTLGFGEKWFGFDLKGMGEKLDKTFYESATQAIFDGGVFGFGDEDNAKNEIVNNLRKYGKSPFVTMFSMIRKWFFPNYASLCASGKYNYLKGKPWLIPVAWVDRGIKVIKKRKTHLLPKLLKKSVASKKQIEQREETLSQWGL